MALFTTQRIEKITEIIKDVAKHYNLSESQIDYELKWLKEKTIPGLENKFYISGEKGLIQECETWIRKNEENTDELRKNLSPDKEQNNLNFFLFAMNIKKHEYILSEINNSFKSDGDELKKGNTSKNGIRLSEIWMPSPKITIEDFLQKGYDLGIWNRNHEIIVAKKSLYGTGKSLLGNLYIALKGDSIKNSIDYKVVGEILCEAFNITNKATTKEPFKAFSSGNKNQINQLRLRFNRN